jgi:hypothetical protein
MDSSIGLAQPPAPRLSVGITPWEWRSACHDDVLDVDIIRRRPRRRHPDQLRDRSDRELAHVGGTRRSIHRSGLFSKWIDVEFGMTERHAQRFMTVAAAYGSKSDIMSGLSPTALYELTAPSTPEDVRAEVERQPVNGAQCRGPLSSIVTVG